MRSRIMLSRLLDYEWMADFMFDLYRRSGEELVKLYSLHGNSCQCTYDLEQRRIVWELCIPAMRSSEENGRVKLHASQLGFYNNMSLRLRLTNLANQDILTKTNVVWKVLQSLVVDSRVCWDYPVMESIRLFCFRQPTFLTTYSHHPWTVDG